MSVSVDHTHDPALRSWVASANDSATDSSIRNLPLGRLRRSGSVEPLRVGVAIGDQVLDPREVDEQAARSVAPALGAGELIAFIAFGPATRRGLRQELSAALLEGSAQRSCSFPTSRCCRQRRPARLGHAVRSRIGAGRLAARALGWRQAADPVRER
jgi:Fumarylacetoacetase N-terminal